MPEDAKGQHSEEEDGKVPAEELESATTKRKNKRQSNPIAKKTRHSKGTGCPDTESKVETKELPETAPQNVSGAESSPAEVKCQAVSAQSTSSSLSGSPASKSRSRRLKNDPLEPSSPSLSTTTGPEPSAAHNLPDSSHTAAACSPQRRRRSQRLATGPDQACPSPHTRDCIAQPSPADGAPKLEEDNSSADKTQACSQNPDSEIPFSAPVTVPYQPPLSEKEKSDTVPSNQTTLEGNPSVAAPGQKVPARTQKNKHAREPIINTRKADDSSAPSELLIDLDHNKFKCKVPGCSKAFRKAKLLDYHLKYYHNTEKEMDTGVCSPERDGRTRATSASMPTSTMSDITDSKRRRTVSTSSCLCIKTERKYKLEDKCQLFVKKRDKDRRDRKEKDLFRIKQKKKKKKKKKSKLHCYSDLDEVSLAYLERQSSPLNRSSSSALKHSTFQYPRAILSVDLTGESEFSCCHWLNTVTRVLENLSNNVLHICLSVTDLSDIDFLEDSTTESLLFSGDEYNQDLDSITMEDFQDEDDDGAVDEIVRCICEMDEENGFMIQVGSFSPSLL
ncbi:hypothetical protein DNTS_017012 [Danionella cerebrum]|uniref:C2H2-type domain-containing protein n=1 Tax=Danionella cerebrum TaxID=2873325 RepID=A0A553NNB8_9TELE|nr:hypothetical protein DNTS_017012 [Danionella translucida]